MQIVWIALFLIIMTGCNNEDRSEDTNREISTEDTISIDSSLADVRVPDNTSTNLNPDSLEQSEGKYLEEENKVRAKNNKENDGKKAMGERLIGKWAWEKTICCGRNPQIYGDTLGYELILNFTKNGQLVYYHDEEIKKTVSYEIVNVPQAANKPALKLSEGQTGPALLQIDNDQLVLNYGYFDLQNEYYKKVK